ncbi:enoyl-CoA hydratase/isomerase family protein [Bradyrhizobium liaoningense]|uniref:enoyl-CoA hydratase/isomerase family protein n=1 Tax=Bradyrhizobium liaoningense TaxID=43992 RepID=UPI001BA63E3B|nr:enoyl-CoA hydratase-related protein [Bradyrhizobium liaoningense]MBR0840384.1 enoyl-CoA hydratase/isomerase family protein [Bradyrhizobium liaoningense]
MTVELSKIGDDALLRLNRPDALNALSFAIIRDIAEALDEVASWKVRSLVVTGAGAKAFCAGADIKELGGRSMIDCKRGAEMGQATFAKLDRLPFASVAAINGFAFGGGLELALACTFRVATPNAKLGLPEIKLGLIPGYGGTQRLPRMIGEARAMEMIMTGRTVGAEEAQRIGLVHRLVEGDAVDAALAFAHEFSGYGLLAQNFAREAVSRALDVPLLEGLKIEADLSTLAFRTTDAVEGMAAFAEKRKANFKDE